MAEGTARPPSLREVLDAGCDLADAGVPLECLAEELFRDLFFLPPKGSGFSSCPRRDRARKAAYFRASAEDLLTNGDERVRHLMWADGSPGRETFEQWVSMELWRAKVYEDEALAQRLREALPADVADVERARMDCYRPHPIEVRVPERWWSCCNCGASFDEGEEAVVVTGREGWSPIDELPFFFDCIAMVAEVVRQAAGS